MVFRDIDEDVIFFGGLQKGSLGREWAYYFGIVRWVWLEDI